MENPYTHIGAPDTDTSPAEEFAGFDGFGEFPEFRPTEQAGPPVDDVIREIRKLDTGG
jgi:hypothetical protein